MLDPKGTWWDNAERIYLKLDRCWWWCLISMNMNMNFQSPYKAGDFLS